MTGSFPSLSASYQKHMNAFCLRGSQAISHRRGVSKCWVKAPGRHVRPGGLWAEHSKVRAACSKLILRLFTENWGNRSAVLRLQVEAMLEIHQFLSRTSCQHSCLSSELPEGMTPAETGLSIKPALLGPSSARLCYRVRLAFLVTSK